MGLLDGKSRSFEVHFGFVDHAGWGVMPWYYRISSETDDNDLKPTDSLSHSAHQKLLILPNISQQLVYPLLINLLINRGQFEVHFIFGSCCVVFFDCFCLYFSFFS
jgi:hypothetical protein